MSYASLHTHSDNSLLDGLSTVDEMAQFAADNGQSAIALTDHGNMHGALKFQTACEQRGVKPILGCELYVAEGGIDVRDRTKTRHLIVLAQNDVGLRNLITLVTRASLEGMFYKPRVDRDMLAEHSAGLIALSGCLGGELAQTILNNGDAYRLACEYRDIFGAENYFLEMQDHGQEDDQIVNNALLQMHRLYGFPLVATQDSHYTHRSEADMHDTMLCMNTNAKKTDEKRFRFSGGPYNLLTEDEMTAKLGMYPDAISNSGEIANMCNARIATGHALLPTFNVPEGTTPDAQLHYLCATAIGEKYTTDMWPPAMNRLWYELEVIGAQNLASYFLIVHDIVTHAQGLGAHIGPGRGSAAGSVVAFLLGITTIDPLRYDLVFERFLNMERFKLPDIDLDIDPGHRAVVIKYIVDKYGTDRVASIVTLNTFQEKNAVQSVMRVMGGEFDGKVYAAARHLEGRAKNLGRHAAGIVISPEPLLGWVPYSASSDPKSAGVITQWEMHDLESVGLLKLDLLGLGNLQTISDTVDLIGGDFNIDQIPLDDQKTYDLLSRGDVVGVFQLDSWGGRKIALQVKPQSIEDISLAISLNRPGPLEGGLIETLIRRKSGHEDIEYLHPSLEPILCSTWGVIVYQEQVMRIASEVAGYSMGEADVFRQAVGKKVPEQMRAEHDRFITGCIHHDDGSGISEVDAEELFRQIEYFSGYGFNLSHGVAYGTVAYQTAYLSAHYPLQFFTALLNNRIDRPEKLAETKKAARDRHIKMLGPDINASTDVFTVDGDSIRYGLTALSGFGKSAYNALAAGRRDAPFTSLDDVLNRCNMSKLNEGALKGLIKAGAMPGDIGLLQRSLAPAMAAWKRQKENDARIKSGRRPIVTRKKVEVMT